MYISGLCSYNIQPILQPFHSYSKNIWLLCVNVNVIARYQLEQFDRNQTWWYQKETQDSKKLYSSKRNVTEYRIPFLQIGHFIYIVTGGWRKVINNNKSRCKFHISVESDTFFTLVRSTQREECYLLPQSHALWQTRRFSLLSWPAGVKYQRFPHRRKHNQ